MDDLSRVSVLRLLDPGERVGPVRQKLNAYLADPKKYSCKLLQLGEAIVALRIVRNDTNAITCEMLRIGLKGDRASIDRFAIADTLATAVVAKKK